MSLVWMTHVCLLVCAILPLCSKDKTKDREGDRSPMDTGEDEKAGANGAMAGADRPPQGIHVAPERRFRRKGASRTPSPAPPGPLVSPRGRHAQRGASRSRSRSLSRLPTGRGRSMSRSMSRSRSPSWRRSGRSRGRSFSRSRSRSWSRSRSPGWRRDQVGPVGSSCRATYARVCILLREAR